MGKLIALFVELFWNNKLKILAFLASWVLMFLLLFPYSDLTETLTDLVSRSTNQSVYFESRALRLSLLPVPGMTFDSVITETVRPPLRFEAQSLTVRPAILSLLLLRPAVKLELDGFAKGEADLSLAVKDRPSANRWQIEVDAETRRLSLEQLARDFQSPLPLSGDLTSGIKGLIECAMDESQQMRCQLAPSAKAQFNLNIRDLKTAGGGPLSLPPMGLQVVQVRATAADNKVTLHETVLGSSADPINGTVQGDFELVTSYGGPTAVGNYTLNVDISMNPETEKNLALVSLFLKPYRAGNTGRYRFSATGNAQMGGTPSFGPYRE